MLVEKAIIVSIPKLQKYVVDETSLEDGLRLGSVQDLAETQKSIFLFHEPAQVDHSHGHGFHDLVRVFMLAVDRHLDLIERNSAVTA